MRPLSSSCTSPAHRASPWQLRASASPSPSPHPPSCGPEAVRAGGLWEAAESGGAASALDDEAAAGPEPEVSRARGVGLEEEGAQVRAQRPATLGIPGVRIRSRGGGRAAATGGTSGVRRAPYARILSGLPSPPPRAGFVLFRGSSDSRRILGDAQAEVGSGRSRARPAGICSPAGPGRKCLSCVAGWFWGFCSPSW